MVFEEAGDVAQDGVRINCDLKKKSVMMARADSPSKKPSYCQSNTGYEWPSQKRDPCSRSSRLPRAGPISDENNVPDTLSEQGFEFIWEVG
jgi:hypothetical protein